MRDRMFVQQRWIFVIYIVLLATLLGLRDIVGYELSKYAFVALILGTSVVVNYQTLISVITFTLPLLWGLPGNYLLPVWALLIIYHQYVNGNLDFKALFFSIFILIWEIVACAFQPYAFSLMDMIAYISSLMLMGLLVTDKGQTEYGTPVLAFCLGCCVLLSYIFIMYIQDPTLVYTEGGLRMGGDMYADDGRMVLRTNANNIGYISVSAIACTLALFYYKKIRIVPCIAIVAVAFICGMYSVSRTWAILVVLTFLVYFIFQKQNRKTGIALLLLFTAAAVFYFMNNASMINAFVARFTGDNIATAGDRFTLFAEYNRFLFTHPLSLVFGTGAQLYREAAGILHSTHNGLQQICVAYGIIGLLIFMFAYVYLIRRNYVKGQVVACLPMIVVFMFIQTIQFLNPYSAMFPMIIAFMVMKMVKR